MELTGLEKRLLTGLSFGAEDIESGNLNEEELAMLMEMRAVDKYLKEKYPDFTFLITGCEPKSGTVKTYNEWFFRPGDEENEDSKTTYSAMAEYTGDDADTLIIKDNFFGEIVRLPIENEINTLLTEAGLSVIEINVSFWEHLGKEYGEPIAYKDVLRAVIPAGNDFKIFLDGSKLSGPPFDATVAAIKTGLQNEGVIGEVYIVVLRDAEADRAKDRLFTKSFSLE